MAMVYPREQRTVRRLKHLQRVNHECSWDDLIKFYKRFCSHQGRRCVEALISFFGQNMIWVSVLCHDRHQTAIIIYECFTFTCPLQRFVLPIDSSRVWHFSFHAGWHVERNFLWPNWSWIRRRQQRCGGDCVVCRANGCRLCRDCLDDRDGSAAVR